MTLRVGIVSANWGTVAHLPAWRAVPGVEVAAICTSRRETAETAASRFGIPKAYWDASEMLTDTALDIVDCGARPSVRQGIVTKAVRAGKHVYNGIPFAADIDHAREIVGAWENSGVVGVVDAFSQWVPSLRRARELLSEGSIGRLLGGSMTFHLSLFNRPAPGFPYNWFAEGDAGVSALRNLGSHALHVLIASIGPVSEVMAHDGQLLSEWHYPDGQVIHPETNDYACLLVRFACGVTIPIQLSWSATAGRGWELDLLGADGRIVVTDPSFPTTTNSRLQVAAAGDRSLRDESIPDRLMRPAGIAAEPDASPQAIHAMAISMQNMVFAIRGEAAAEPDFRQAWQVERTLEAARLSSQERRWVALSEIA